LRSSASFVDDWGELTVNGAHYNLPPSIAFRLKTTVFLHQVPVRAITAVELDGTPADASKARWDIPSGKLFNIRPGTDMAEDLSQALLGSRAKVTYTAGWAEMPPDLYAVLQGALAPLWASRQSQQVGGIGGTPTEINVIDVGSVTMSANNSFVDATLKGGGADDPLLGPWVSNLTSYKDWRNVIGVDCFPTTKDGPAVPP